MRQGVVPLYNLPNIKCNVCIWIVVSECVCVCVCVSVEQRKTLPVCYFPAQMFIKYICFNAAERCLHWEKVKDSAKHVWGVQKVAKAHLHTEKAQHKSV